VNVTFDARWPNKKRVDCGLTDRFGKTRENKWRIETIWLEPRFGNPQKHERY